MSVSKYKYWTYQNESTVELMNHKRTDYMNSYFLFNQIVLLKAKWRGGYVASRRKPPHKLNCIGFGSDMKHYTLVGFGSGLASKLSDSGWVRTEKCAPIHTLNPSSSCFHISVMLLTWLKTCQS